MFWWIIISFIKKAHPDLSESQLCSVRLQASCMRRISFITDNPGETLRAQRAWQRFLQLVAHTATPWERFFRNATQTEIENKKNEKEFQEFICLTNVACAGSQICSMWPQFGDIRYDLTSWKVQQRLVYLGLCNVPLIQSWSSSRSVFWQQLGQQAGQTASTRSLRKGKSGNRVFFLFDFAHCMCRRAPTMTSLMKTECPFWIWASVRMSSESDSSCLKSSREVFWCSGVPPQGPPGRLTAPALSRAYKDHSVHGAGVDGSRATAPKWQVIDTPQVVTCQNWQKRVCVCEEAETGDREDGVQRENKDKLKLN